MKKTTQYSLVILCMLAFLISGCTPQSNAPQETPSAASSTGAAAESTVPDDQPSTTTQKGSMKTQADFEKIDAKSVTLTTSKGEIVVELYPTLAPTTVASFLSLVKTKFYDGIIVHRVEPGFVIQAGDPLTKEKGKEQLWGTGGPGYTIPDEFSKEYKYDQEGILAMAKTAAPNSGGSQFFITLGPAEFLNGQYTVFGKVTKGLDVVKKITVGDTIITATFTK